MIVLNKVSRKSIFPGFNITVTKKKGSQRMTIARLFNDDETYAYYDDGSIDTSAWDLAD